ncbi:trypsin-like serine protease, partial [Kibdelosporangium lantanae]
MLAATLGLTAAPVATAQGPVAASSSQPGVTPDIVGGQPATQPYPFEGALLLDHHDGQGPGFHCGATLVAKLDGMSWFATNAHCVTPEGETVLYSPSDLRVALGSNLRSQQITYPVAVVTDVPFWSWTTPHPGPNGEQGDVALVGLPVLVPARPLLIAPSQVGDGMRVIGWGLWTAIPLL